MKKFSLSVILLSILISTANSQELIDLPLAPRVDTTNTEVKAVVELWQKHLSNQPDQIYENPYWSEQQSKHYD